MKKYRAGVIGLGRIGSTFEDDPKRVHPCTHAGALAISDTIELVAGSARTMESAERFRTRWGLKKSYTDYVQMVKDERLDIVAVATNPETHAEIIENIAPLGIKGILCEKPIALDLKEADRMIEVCRENNVVLMTMHNRRFNSIYRSAKKLIEDGTIGTVNSVVGICQGCKPSKNWQSDFEGPLLHDATHLFDIMRYLFGDVEYVQSAVESENRESNIEDSAYTTIKFKNGVYGMTLVNERTDYMRFELEIQASKGKMVLLTNEAYLWTYADSKYASGFRELKAVDYPIEPIALNAYVEAYKELCECIESGLHDDNSSTGRDGREALDIIMSIYESEIKNGARIYLPLPSIPSTLTIAKELKAF